jgi:hypothetical protein
VRQSILSFEEYNTTLSLGSGNDLSLSGNLNINRNNYKSTASYETKGNLNLDRFSIISSKDNPNEFEKFNFESEEKKYKIGKFYGNGSTLNINKDYNDISTKNNNQIYKINERDKKMGLSFVKNSSTIYSNFNKNSKTFINLNSNNDYYNNLNISLLRGENVNSKNTSEENVNNIIADEKETNIYEDYDSNFDNSVLIETPKVKNRLLNDD